MSTLLSIVFIGNAFAQESQLFKDYVTAQNENKEAVLPNFSYAGVDHGQKLFIEQTNQQKYKVEDYGAIPNDGLSDRDAITSAINAAIASGGIVEFPAGRLDINTASDPEVPMKFTLGNHPLTLKGHPDGTELYMENTLPSPTPDKMWSTPYMIQFTGSKTERSLTSIVESADQGSKSIVVQNASSISAGDWILLSLSSRSSQLLAEELLGMTAEDTWTKIINDGVKVRAVHQVESVDGNTIHLKSCLLKGVNPDYPWQVYSKANHEGLIISDLNFTGTWKDSFQHHKNIIHDGGHSMLQLKFVTNFTVMNCTFTDVNRALNVGNGVNGTILNNQILGNGGHNGISVPGCNNVLVGMNKDLAGQWHTFGVSGLSIGNVFWRNEHSATTSFEAHASQPRTTLYDNAKGGFMFGRLGGAVSSLPNHMEELVLWNYNETDAPESNYEFWSSTSKYGKVVPPIVVGFHGSGTSFVSNQISHQESHGTKVSPESLYEAQIELRLGALPEWICALKECQTEEEEEEEEEDNLLDVGESLARDGSILSVGVENNGVLLNLIGVYEQSQLVQIYTISGRRVYNGEVEFESNEALINVALNKNQIYVLRVDNKVVKFISQD
ncbi:MAG: DUF4955 domain-containing protein [Cyclobacteriaceae bacterium]